VLRTVGDARTYMLALPKEREWLDHWKPAYRLLVVGAGAAELTRQVHLAPSVDGEFDSEAFENLSASRQWRPGTPIRDPQILIRRPPACFGPGKRRRCRYASFGANIAIRVSILHSVSKPWLKVGLIGAALIPAREVRHEHRERLRLVRGERACAPPSILKTHGNVRYS
jgi:hypothetical protein